MANNYTVTPAVSQVLQETGIGTNNFGTSYISPNNTVYQLYIVPNEGSSISASDFTIGGVAGVLVGGAASWAKYVWNTENNNTSGFPEPQETSTLSNQWGSSPTGSEVVQISMANTGVAYAANNQVEINVWLYQLVSMPVSDFTINIDIDGVTQDQSGEAVVGPDDVLEVPSITSMIIAPVVSLFGFSGSGPTPVIAGTSSIVPGGNVIANYNQFPNIIQLGPYKDWPTVATDGTETLTMFSNSYPTGSGPITLLSSFPQGGTSMYVGTEEDGFGWQQAPGTNPGAINTPTYFTFEPEVDYSVSKNTMQVDVDLNNNGYVEGRITDTLINPDLYSGPDGAVGYVYKNTLYVGGATPINTNNNPTTFYNPIVYLSNDLSNPVSNVISSIKLADSNPWPFTPGASPDSMSNAQNWVNNKVYMEINWNPNFNWLPFDFKVLFTLQASGLALNSSSVEDIAFEAAFTVNFNY